MPKLPLANCDDCPLYGAPTAVPGYGPDDATLVVVGEAPGAFEEAQGIPFVGQSGQLLNAAFKEADPNFDPETQVFKTNVVACRPPGNRAPTQLEMQCCRPRLLWEIEQVRARKILALGNTAHEAFGVPSNQKGAIFTVGDHKVMPAWHPAYILREPGEASEFLAQVWQAVNGPFERQITEFPEVRWARTLAELEQTLAECPSGAWVAFDIETDQTRWYATETEGPDMILMLQITWDERFAVVMDDVMLYDTPGVTRCLQDFFERVLTVGHNSKFDCVFLKGTFGLNIHQYFDTMLAHYALDENQQHGLKAIARLEFGIPDYEDETIKPYLRTRNDRYSKVPVDILAQYGAMDVAVTLKLREVLMQRLHKEGLYEYPFLKVLMEAANGLVDVEIRGIKVDKQQLDVLSTDFETELDSIRTRVRDSVEEPNLNLNAPGQLAAVMYDKLGLPIIRGRKIKPRSTAHEALVKLRGMHPMIEDLLTYRRIAKMKASYVDNLLGFIGEDGRVHANFKIPGTEVGRISIADPALQTIPRPAEYFGALIRSLFIAEPGWLLGVCDYSQAELRVFACESGEPFLLQVYKDGRDLHSEVAAGMYGPNYTKEQRVMCKMFNFSYLYGGSEYSFAQDAGLNIEVAKQFVKNYNTLMPIGLAYKKEMLEKLKADGYVQTAFGRRRHFPLITNENHDEARKACVHVMCAGTASDLTLLSGLEAQNKGVGVVLMVHDSVVFEAPEHEMQDQGALLKKIMESTATDMFPEIPWKVDFEAGPRWAEPLPRS